MTNQELIESSKDEYLQRLLAMSSEFSSSEKLRTPRPSIDIDGFFACVGNIISKQQEIDGAQKKIFYSEDFPEKDDDINGEVITYTLAERVPGSISQGNSRQSFDASAVRMVKPSLREVSIDPDNIGSMIYTFSQWFDNKVEFSICAKTNKIANRRAMWFESLLADWEWYLQANGLAKIVYEGRGPDQVFSFENKKVVMRPLMYYIRTEKITVVREAALRSIDLRTSLE